MGTSIGIGYSTSRNAAVAGREAALRALEQGRIARADFLLVFATVGYDQRTLLRAVRETTGSAPLSGCSGEGIITRGVATESNFCVAVMALASDELHFDHLLVLSGTDGPEALGKRLALQLQATAQPDAMAYLLLADGLSFDFEPMLHSFEASLPTQFHRPILGGLASDNWTLRKTYQYHDDEVVTRGVVLVQLCGSGSVAWGVNHGCVPVGTKRTITRSRANVIYEIDGIPALDAFRDYIEGDLKSQWNKVSLNLCLGFKTPKELRADYDEYVIRYMMDKKDAEGAVVIQSDVEEGADLWIVRRDKELIRAGVQAVANQLRKKTSATPKLVLQFECVGRGKVVFREQEKMEIIRALQQQIGPEVPWIGFYTYGEIAPVGAVNFFHNFSVVLAAVY